jgi:hypothetical protein
LTSHRGDAYHTLFRSVSAKQRGRGAPGRNRPERPGRERGERRKAPASGAGGSILLIIFTRQGRHKALCGSAVKTQAVKRPL